MAHDELHVNDASTIIVTLTEDGVATDVSAATAIQFHFQRPDKSTFFKVGSFVTDGVDGQVKYKLVSDPTDALRDLDIDGPWKLQVKIKESADDFNSAVGDFRVHRNIPV
jgi:hypothetical protein